MASKEFNAKLIVEDKNEDKVEEKAAEPMTNEMLAAEIAVLKDQFSRFLATQTTKEEEEETETESEEKEEEPVPGSVR